jgi:chromosome segregation ATPase
MSSESPPHRRSRSEHESDNETDSLRGPQYKRARTNGYHSEGQSEDSEQESHAPETSRRSQFRPANTSDDDDDDDEHSNLNIFQPGAILRVKLTNFVTYENAEFFPGPSLNMVIGPNGTGKSSLVCAICLGLGWGPQVLGRATDVGSYVKNGTDAAEIEIELQRKEGEATNYVVRLRITKDGNTREWWLGGKKTSFKAIQALTRSLSIQIDNLCQFLPQDKVSSFSGLSPVELLQRTQEAAAPPQMLEWHDNLKKLRKEEKELTDQQATDQAQLGNLETRQQNLRAEVERLQERQDIEKRVKFLKYAMPLVEYNLVIARYRQCKNEKIQAQARFKELKDKIAPTLRAVTEKKHYHDEINAVVVERRMKVEFFERQADACIETMERLQNEAKAHDEEIDKWRKTRSQLHKEIVNTQTTIRSLQARQKEASVEFNPAEWNDRVVC